MSPKEFQDLIASVTREIADRDPNSSLADWLNRTWPPQSEKYEALADACRIGAEQGWLCNREAGGIRFGRIFKALPETNGFSVDVVRMKNIVGPHHVHPNGEIDLIIPLEDGATFDGHPAGWCVYGTGSAHCPTVANGDALVLYLLPQGAIEFTPPPSLN
jgi:hypothetical protein